MVDIHRHTQPIQLTLMNFLILFAILPLKWTQSFLHAVLPCPEVNSSLLWCKIQFSTTYALVIEMIYSFEMDKMLINAENHVNRHLTTQHHEKINYYLHCNKVVTNLRVFQSNAEMKWVWEMEKFVRWL